MKYYQFWLAFSFLFIYCIFLKYSIKTHDSTNQEISLYFSDTRPFFQSQLIQYFLLLWIDNRKFQVFFNWRSKKIIKIKNKIIFTIFVKQCITRIFLYYCLLQDHLNYSTVWLSIMLYSFLYIIPIYWIQYPICYGGGGSHKLTNIVFAYKYYKLFLHDFGHKTTKFFSELKSNWSKTHFDWFSQHINSSGVISCLEVKESRTL